MIGERFAHYEISAKLGEGGMGEVYRSTDTKLGREVAMKLLPAEMSKDPGRLERFKREAQTIASLNHPNIVTIHSVEEEGGRHFLTMELVDGQTLDRLMRFGGLPVSRLFELAIPIADAPAEAHAQGITHRDIKPANVMVNGKGQVKILDFGLAKLAEDGAVDGGTATEALTQDGLVVGTVHYMSPEQARGEPADPRSDVFSLGVLLFEIATGTLPFQGNSSVEILSSILRDEPASVSDVNAELPNHLGRVVRRCLEKDPDKRYQSALDIRNELQSLRREIDSGVSRTAAVPPPAASSSAPDWKRLVPYLLAVLIAAPFTWWALRDRAADPPGSEAGSASRAAAERPMIVVLPFENLGSPDDEYFSEGMTDEVINRLTSVAGLGVISRTTAFQYSTEGKSLPTIARELRVDHVVTGTVRWSKGSDGPSRVRITPRLANAAEDRQVWSQTFERDVADVFAVQDEIASKVAASLGLAFATAERAAFQGATPEAYQAYLKANSHHVRPGGHSHDLRQALRLAETATDLAPGFAAAWALLAEANAVFVIWGRDLRPERLEQARAALARAQALAPDSPEAIWARARILYAEGDYEAALAAYQDLNRLEPANPRVANRLGSIYRRLGRFEESAEELERAAELDPLDASSNLASTCVMLRRHECADRASSRAIELVPDQVIGHFLKFLNLLLWRGDLEAAAQVAAGLEQAEGFWAVWIKYHAALLARDGAAALAVLDETSLDALTHFRGYWPKDLLRARAYRITGEAEAERLALEAAEQHLRGELDRRPKDPRIWATLGIVLSRLDRPVAAVEAGEQAVSLFPLERDPYTAPAFLVDLAETYAHSGRPDDAVATLEQVLSIPELLTPHYIQLDPRWDPLRGQPGFERITAAEVKGPRTSP